MAARDVFNDPFALDWLDEGEDYGEDPYAVIGMSEGRLLFVAYTVRRVDPHHFGITVRITLTVYSTPRR